MKRLNTIQELWSALLFCPICQDITREIQIEAGPYETTEVKSHIKKDHILKLVCLARLGSKQYNMVYYIDCLKNTFTISINEIGEQNPPVNKASSPTFFIFMMGICRQCNSTHTNSSDLEIDILSKEISNIGITTEGIYVLNQKDKYHLTLQHDQNNMLVSKCFEDEHGEIVDDNKPISFPLAPFDFSKPNKVIKRIKTLLVFS